MSVTIKRPEELELMREAGKILAKVHEQLGNELRPGMSTYEIDRIGEEMIRSFGCEPSFKNYCGYPASVCVSIDEEVVHGIPSKEKFIQEGDIVSLDIGVIHKGYHSDAARTHAVGEISKEAELLIERTRQSFFEGMKYAAAGRHLYEISGAIGSYAESFGYGVVRDLCGHGIGTHLHEEPDIPNFKKFRRGMKLKSGMTLAVEPMINIGTPDVLWLDDEWTVITADMSLSAHYENTIIITEGRPEILTGFIVADIRLVATLFDHDGMKHLPILKWGSSKRKIKNTMLRYDKNFSFDKFEGQLVSLVRMAVLAEKPEELACYRADAREPLFSDILEMTYTNGICLNGIRMEGNIMHMSVRTWWVKHY